MSSEELRAENIEEAKDIFEDFNAIIESGLVPWIWQKKRQDRTRLVISVMSFLRLLRNEFVFFNPKYLQVALSYWKDYSKHYPGTDKWIRIYETRLKSQSESRDKMSEIGERFVDLSSSRYPIPKCFSMVLEYEVIPKWGEIIVDFRKLLSVLAPVKVGIFHLPARPTTDKVYTQDEKTGELKWIDEILDSDKPDRFMDDIRAEIEPNVLEHPYTVYLVILVHAQVGGNEVNVHGYLLWRETTGEVKIEKLQSKKYSSNGLR